MLTISSQDVAKEWILNSGCSFHICPNRVWFQTFNQTNGGKVLLGDKKACTVAGIGKIKLGLEDGSERILHKVRYVPDLKRNLISIRVLDREGYSFKSQG